MGNGIIKTSAVYLHQQYLFPCLNGILDFQACFVCVEVLRPSQSNGVMSSAVSLPHHTFTGQA